MDLEARRMELRGMIRLASEVIAEIGHVDTCTTAANIAGKTLLLTSGLLGLSLGGAGLPWERCMGD